MHYYHKVKRALNRSAFVLTGKRPWSRGYGEYREEYIRDVLTRGEFSADKLPRGYGFRLDERVIEYPWLFSRLPETPGRALDAGSVLNHDFLLTQPKLRSKQLFISTLAPESVAYTNLAISYAYEDFRSSCFRDDYFDWIICLSTLEHVGMDNTLLYTTDERLRESDSTAYSQAVGELRRMLKPGGTAFVSVPFGRRHNHGWFQIFDSAMVDDLIDMFSPAAVSEWHFRYLADGWTPSSRANSQDATYFDIHRQKTYDSDFAAASRAIVCLELKK